MRTATATVEKNTDPDLLQTCEVAALADRGPERVRQAVQRGDLRPAVVTSVGQRLFARTEARRWIATLPKRVAR